jgi:peptide/nickel transport system substrate-binding protein
MARRIRWQIVTAVIGVLLIAGVLAQLALSTTAVAEPRAGGSYIEAVPGAPAQLIPLLNDPLSDPVGRDIAALLFDGLTRLGFDGLPEGALAESWRIDQDGRIYIFELRDDVLWHDGTPFTADDVVFTVRAIQDENFTGNPSLVNLWQNVLVDRLDDYTVRFTLSAPYSPFLSVARLPILPAHLLRDIPVEEWATSSFATEPVGTGPYQLARLEVDRAELRVNREYFIERPFIDRLELRFIDSPQATFALFETNEIQALGASTATAPELNQLGLPEGVRRISTPLDEYAVLTFNLREPPLDQLALRRALARGLSKSTLLEQVLNGQVARIDNPILPGWWPFDPTIGWYAYDAETATEVLDALGYEETPEGVRERNDEPLSLPLITDGDPGRLAAAREIARQWAVIGVEVDVTQLEREELRQRLRERDFMLAVHGWARLGADPDIFELWHSSQADDGLNYAGLRDDTIDELLTRGRIERDLAARNESYAAFQRRWVELVPSITLYQPLYSFTVSDAVDGLGFEQTPFGRGVLLVGREDRYRNITNWFVQSSREIRETLR